MARWLTAASFCRSQPQQRRDAAVELLELQGDYQQWLDGLPECLADSTTADALRTVCELDVATLEVGLAARFWPGLIRA